jgi:hypothetical protein
VAGTFLPEQKGSSAASAGGEQPATALTNGRAGSGCGGLAVLRLASLNP